MPLVEGAPALRLRFLSLGDARKGCSSMSGAGERLEEERERVRGRRDGAVVERVWRRLDRLGERSSEARAVSRAMREVRIVLVLDEGGDWV